MQDHVHMGNSADFTSIRGYLDTYTSCAAADLDAARLGPAYEALEKLCQQHAYDALCHLDLARVPLWHHKLLLDWSAKQSKPRVESRVSTDDVIQIHPDLWAEARLGERCGEHGWCGGGKERRGALS